MSYVLQHTQAVNDEAKFNMQVTQIVARLAGVEVEDKVVGVPEIPKISAFGQQPILNTPRGVFTGLNCAKAVAQGVHNKLTGICPGQAVVVDEYLQAVKNILDLTANLIALEKSKSTENDKINAVNKLVAYLKPFNAALVNNTFLLGNFITIADIALVVALQHAFANWFGPKKRTELASLYRLFITINGQKAAKRVLEPVTVAEKDAWVMPDLTQQKAEKVVDPMSTLPKSETNLDSVKKLFGLEQPYNPAFATEVWNGFDYAGYTFYEVDFKYNADEWEKEFLCENGVNGFLNRGEGSKKYVFLVLNQTLVGKFYHINGAAIVRGSPDFNAGEIPEALKSCGDAEEYAWNKIDVTTDEGKKKFLARFMTDSFGGNPVLKRFQLK